MLSASAPVAPLSRSSSVQLALPAGAASKRTLSTPEPPSLAVAPSATSPRSMVAVEASSSSAGRRGVVDAAREQRGHGLAPDGVGGDRPQVVQAVGLAAGVDAQPERRRAVAAERDPGPGPGRGDVVVDADDAGARAVRRRAGELDRAGQVGAGVVEGDGRRRVVDEHVAADVDRGVVGVVDGGGSQVVAAVRQHGAGEDAAGEGRGGADRDGRPGVGAGRGDVVLDGHDPGAAVARGGLEEARRQPCSTPGSRSAMAGELLSTLSQMLATECAPRSSWLSTEKT